MSIRDAELEFELNPNDYWLDELSDLNEFDADFYDEDDWTIEDEDTLPYDEFEDYADDFAEWEIDLEDDEV